MNLKFLLLILIVATANLAEADDGSTVHMSIKLGPSLAPRPDAPAPTTSPVTLAPRQPVTQAPEAPTATSVVSQPEIPDIPKCNARYPYNPKYSTDNIGQIDHALLTATGYGHAFNSHWQLDEDPVKGNNQCHAAIRKTSGQSGASVPQIIISGCTPATLALPARACQTGNTIKFLVDSSNVDGLLSMALPRNFEVNFSKSDIYQGRWMVKALGVTAHLKEAAASASMR